MRTLLTALLLAPLVLSAQESATPPPPAAACDTEQHRQFDFWVGDWTVTQGGQPAGENRIIKVNGGCVVAEHWTSATAGFTGRSLNIYDRSADAWHQTWVDSSGLLLQIDGGMEDGAMVMQGTTTGADGKILHNRITWTPNPDGSVRQHWETRAEGADWSTAFDGLYVRAEPSAE